MPSQNAFCLCLEAFCDAIRLLMPTITLCFTNTSLTNTLWLSVLLVDSGNQQYRVSSRTAAKHACKWKILSYSVTWEAWWSNFNCKKIVLSKSKNISSILQNYMIFSHYKWIIRHFFVFYHENKSNFMIISEKLSSCHLRVNFRLITAPSWGHFWHSPSADSFLFSKTEL